MRDGDWQGPTSGVKADCYSDLLDIVSHPAFRIGFLDAQRGREFDHDRILQRIEAETPASALARIGWGSSGTLPGLFDGPPDKKKRSRVEIAQYRYEEGRLLVVAEGLKCKAWGHPDYPPRQVEEFIWNRAKAPAPEENGPI